MGVSVSVSKVFYVLDHWVHFELWLINSAVLRILITYLRNGFMEA